MTTAIKTALHRTLVTIRLRRDDRDPWDTAETWLETLRHFPRRYVFARLLGSFKRRDWVAGQQDPTAVTRYAIERRHFALHLTASWGVESELRVGRRVWWAYDNRIAVWAFAGLEEATAIAEEMNEAARQW